MRRRHVLHASALGLASLAGCQAGGGGPGATTTTDQSPTTTDHTSPPPTTTAERSTTTTPSPAPAPASGVFDGFECPSFDDEADRTVCYHGVDPAEADVVLSVGTEVFDPDYGDDVVETLPFRLYNRSQWHVHLNPDGWRIARLEDGAWTHVAPEAHDVPLVVLSPGQTYVWELPSEPHPTPRPNRYRLLDVELAAGTYAFHVAGRLGAGLDETPTADPPDERVELVGLFRLVRAVDPDRQGGTTDSDRDETNASR